MTALGLRGVSLAALNRTHDKKLTAHLFLSALMPRPHARSDDIFQHSSALNRTQPALMAFSTKTLSYRQTAHVRVGPSLAFALLAPTLPELSQKPRSSAAPEEFPLHILPRGEMPGQRGQRLTCLHISLAKEVIPQEIAPLLSTLLWHRPRWNQTEAM